MSLPDELKTQMLDASVGGIEAFLTCIGCCVVALHPKGRHDKAMKEYCLSSEFFEKFIDQWGRRWSRPRPPSRSRKSSHSPQPHCPAPNPTTPMKSRHKKNNSSGGVQFLPSPQSPESDMVSGASTPRPSAGDDSLFENRPQASTSSFPSPASAPSAENFIDASAQLNPEDEWSSFFDSLLDPPQENTGYLDPGFYSNNTCSSISTSTGPEETFKLPLVPFEEGVMPRAPSETIGRNIIRPFSNSVGWMEHFPEAARIVHERRQVGPSSREPKRGKAQNQIVPQDGHLTKSKVGEVPTITVETPNGTLSSPVIYSFGGVGQRLPESVSSQGTGQNSGIRSNDQVFETQDRRPYVQRAVPIAAPPSIHGKRERAPDPKDAIQYDIKKRRRMV